MASSRAGASQGLECCGEGQPAWSNTKRMSRDKGRGEQAASTDAAMGGHQAWARGEMEGGRGGEARVGEGWVRETNGGEREENEEGRSGVG